MIIARVIGRKKKGVRVRGKKATINAIRAWSISFGEIEITPTLGFRHECNGIKRNGVLHPCAYRLRLGCSHGRMV